MSKQPENKSEKPKKMETEVPHPAKPDKEADKHLIQELQQQVADWKDKALRVAAEMENLRKRTQLDIEKNTKFANAHFAKDLLPVLDCLQGALSCVPEKTEGIWKNLVIGIEMTLKQFLTTLKANGIEKMDCLGQVFNPHFQKVVQEVVDNTKPAGTIIKELQSGYTIGGDRVLREAMVVVSKAE